MPLKSVGLTANKRGDSKSLIKAGGSPISFISKPLLIFIVLAMNGLFV
jgi:hypothetical protein